MKTQSNESYAQQRCKNCGTLIAEGPEKCRVCPACGYQGLESVGGQFLTGRVGGGYGGQRVVECPICGGRNEPARTFRCPECGRDGLCLDHRDGRTRWCEECAESHTKGTKCGNLTGSEAGERMTVRVGAQHVAFRWCPAARSHGKVQLWAGGPYWAETNIGADKPEDYGLYFWWGDTIGYRREGNIWIASDGSSRNYSFEYGDAPTSMDNATLQRCGWTTSAGVLSPEHDAAHIHWGGDWRMPTFLELDDLVRKCDWTWTTMNGVAGYVVRGRGAYAGANIFLPAAGYGDETSLLDVDSDGDYWGNYWSSDSMEYECEGDSSDSNTSLYLAFCSGGYDANGDIFRYNGLSIRPVQGSVN